MIAANILRSAGYAFLLSSILVVSSRAETASGGDQSVLQRSTLVPQKMSDGTLRIKKKQLIMHIGTPGVFILSDDGRARFRMVKAGKAIGQSVEIISGLSGNERILNGPYESILDGSVIHSINTRMEKKQ